ncbi:MAG TPA: hypothetical protein VG518_08870 [Solirubrobacterales bacterium]|nr:hypothetical protein [Solirubrobacterales bacterium]
MADRLRPTAPIAADAILVGDPGRALLLAQELLDSPKMSNHARGLWGYGGKTASGDALTIQSTGIGGPSASLVLGELAELGVKRAIRVGTCVGLDGELEPGDLLLVDRAQAGGGSATAHGVAVGDYAYPAAGLNRRLATELGKGARVETVASYDVPPPTGASAGGGAGGADMQTAPLLARAQELGVEVAALLIVAETAGGRQLGPEELAEAEKRAGRIAQAAL